MAGQLLETKQKSDVEIITPKQAIKEHLAELVKLKNRKDDLLLPIQEELIEIEEKDKKIQEEITMLMQDVKETIFTDDAKAIWKTMPRPREIYDKEALDAISDEKIREVLDNCKKFTKQGDPKVNIEVY